MPAEEISRLPPYWRSRMASAPHLSVWPPLLAPHHAQIVSGLAHLESTQWLPPEELRRAALLQAQSVLRFAARGSRHYRATLAGIDLARPLTEDTWRKIPLLSRRDLQRSAADITCSDIPAQHGSVAWTQTSGSTGEPVRVSSTGLTRLFHGLFALRDHAWHERDLAGRLAAIRYTQKKGVKSAAAPDGLRAPSWGSAGDGLFRTGPFGLLEIDTDVPAQMRWLLDFDPDYLLTYPNNLAALLEHTARHGERPPRLKAVRTLGESVSPDLRRACQDTWGAPVVDMYTTEEVGYVALQCPKHEHLHVQSEGVIVEVLDDTGAPAAPGELGRVVVTALHNLSMPLIRYDIGDLGELGPPCDCGRGLPVLRRVVGRSRGLFTLPSGERRWPLVGFARFREVAPAIRQFQIVQETRNLITARFTVDAPLTADEEGALTEVIRAALRHPFAVRFECPAVIAREKNGKLHDVWSRV